jgi:hypothetical protein
MCRVMADRYLDQLLFGQGEGTAVCRDFRAEALRPLREYQLRQ